MMPVIPARLFAIVLAVQAFPSIILLHQLFLFPHTVFLQQAASYALM